MTRKKAAPKDEDEAQSRRFLDLASELEAAGDLSLTEGEVAFEQAVGKALSTRKRSFPE